MPRPMNSATPQSDPDPPQPLDYASPQVQRTRRPHWVLLWSLLVLIFTWLIWSVSSLTSCSGARTTANRVKSASNLRQIGQAILLYTNDHQGEYPDSFQTIFLNEDVTSWVFVSPSRAETPAIGSTTQATAGQMGAGGHLSYVYLGRGLSANTVSPNTIVAYEMIPSPGGGTNVLFGDGHVEWVGPATAAKIVSRAGTGQFPVTLPTDGTWGQ